jgi:hypothetical protein
MKLFTLATCIMMVIFTHTLEGATYYVSSSGDDANPGTSPSRSWASIAKVNATAFAAGDTVLFQGGATFSGGLDFGPEDKGTAASPIVVGSFGTGRATISSGGLHGLYAYNTAGFEVRNLVFMGPGRTSSSTSGVSFYMDRLNTRLPHIVIDSVEVFGYRDIGILIGSWNGGSGYDDVSITNSASHDNGDAGIATYAEAVLGHRNVYVAHCKAYNNPGIEEKTNLHSGNGIILGGVDGATIEYCQAYNNGWLNAWTGGGPVGIWGYSSNNLVIQHNESHHNRTGTGKDGGGFDLDGGCTNSIMQYNYSHDNEGAGYLVAQYSGAPTMKGLTIRYNISENDGRKNNHAGIMLWSSGSNGGIQDTEIYNNTIYLTPSASGYPSAFYMFGNLYRNVSVRNNIFQTTGGREVVINRATDAIIRFEGNNYWASGATPKFIWPGGTYTSLEAWRSATGQETLNGIATGLYTNPELKDPGKGVNIGNPQMLYTLHGYELKETTSLTGKGLNLTALFGTNTGTRDFFGNSIMQRSDLTVGAHQLTDNSKACLYGGTIQLTFGESTDGTYSGPGVVDGKFFDPQHTGAGNAALIYSFIDANLQQQLVHHTIEVVDASATEWTGAGTSGGDWFDSDNWSTCVPTGLVDTTVPAAQVTPNIPSGTSAAVNGLLATGTFSVEDGGTLEINGHMAGGSITAAPLSIVVFKSSDMQQIPAASFGKLVLQGNGPKQLTSSVTVASELELGSSKLYLGDHILTIGSQAVIKNYSSNSYIVTDGPGKITYNAIGGSRTGVFPVGTPLSYAPVTLENAGVVDHFSVRVDEGFRQEATEGDTITEGVVNKTWHIEEATTGGSDVHMTLQWNESDELDKFTREESFISHYEGDTWGPQKETIGTAAAGSETGTYIKSISSVTSFSPFGVSSSGYMPMPVTLSYFSANRQGHDALLQWETAMEQGNKGFGVEVSEDSATFRTLVFISSKGADAQHRQQYSFRDTEHGKNGTRYYRLRQTDLDGTTTLSTVKSVTFEPLQAATVSAYPNPFSNNITLDIATATQELAHLTVTDALGRTVYSRKVDLKPGVNKINLPLSADYPAGLYIVTARFATNTFQLKVLKQ